MFNLIEKFNLNFDALLKFKFGDKIISNKVVLDKSTTPDNSILIITNIIKLFELHGVKRHEIPIFISNLSIKDTLSDESFYKALTQEMIYKICKLFNVKYEWIIGEDVLFYSNLLSFYKNPSEFIHFYEKRNITEVYLLLSDGQKFNQNINEKKPPFNNGDNFLLLREPLKKISGRTIYKNYILHDCNVNYWKSWGYTVAYLSQMANNRRKKGVYVTAAFCNKTFMDKLLEGREVNISSLLQESSFVSFRDIEDVYLCPYCFLNPVNPETAYYGYIQALKLWLELYKLGFICINYPYKVKESFEKMLQFYENPKNHSKKQLCDSHLPYSCKLNV